MSKRMRGCGGAVLLVAGLLGWSVSAVAQAEPEGQPSVAPEEPTADPVAPEETAADPLVAPEEAASPSDLVPAEASSPPPAPVQTVAVAPAPEPAPVLEEPAVAEEDAAPREIPNTPAWRANVGFIKTTGIAILFADGATGVGLELSARYGIPAGPFIVAPGARIGGYYIAERLLGLAMPTGRLTIPIGPLAPFVQGGAGVGGLTNPGNGGWAWMGGGGLMIHTGGALSFGVEVNYSGVTSTGVETLTVGPVITIGG